MKVNILQFENATMQALHEKAATVANAQVTYGPFVGAWWEHYLSVVIETAQAEQRLASAKDVAEIRGFYDILCAEHDKAIADLKETTAMLEQTQQQLTREQELRGVSELECNTLRERVKYTELAAACGMGNERLRFSPSGTETGRIPSTAQNESNTPKEGNVGAAPVQPVDNEAAVQSDTGKDVTAIETGTEDKATALVVGPDTVKVTVTKPVYDNPVTYTARPNPFLPK